MKKIFDKIYNMSVDGFSGTSTHFDTLDSDVVVHQYEIGGEPWATIFQEYCDSEEVDQINIAGETSIRELINALENLLKKYE